LISIKRFTVDASVLGLRRHHVGNVALEGLDIEIAPEQADGEINTQGSRSSRGSRGSQSSGENQGSSYGDDVVIDTLDSSDARIVVIPRRKNRQPKIWEVHTLRMHRVGIGQSMPFDATLTNAVPPGEIVTSGHFGPWREHDPGATPIDGRFTFDR